MMRLSSLISFVIRQRLSFTPLVVTIAAILPGSSEPLLSQLLSRTRQTNTMRVASGFFWLSPVFIATVMPPNTWYATETENRALIFSTNKSC